MVDLVLKVSVMPLAKKCRYKLVELFRSSLYDYRSQTFTMQPVFDDIEIVAESGKSVRRLGLKDIFNKYSFSQQFI
jgi:hypothetical protein